MIALGVFLCLFGTYWLMRTPAQSRSVAQLLRPRGARGVPSPDSAAENGAPPLNAPLALDLIAVILSSGASLGRSLAVIATDVAQPESAQLTRLSSALQLGIPFEQALRVLHPPECADPGCRKHVSEPLGLLIDSLTFTASTGAPSASALLATAFQLRRRAAREAQRRAARLGVRLVVPLGICVLPAFICLGILPLLISVFPQLW